MSAYVQLSFAQIRALNDALPTSYRSNDANLAPPKVVARPTTILQGAGIANHALQAQLECLKKDREADKVAMEQHERRKKLRRRRSARRRRRLLGRSMMIISSGWRS
jgi:hypothetical protein